MSGFAQYAYDLNASSRIRDLRSLIRDYEQNTRKSYSLMHHEVKMTLKSHGGTAHEQTFSQEFEAPFFDAKYTLHWDIPTAQHLCADKEPEVLPILELMENLSPETKSDIESELDSGNRSRSGEPIIAVRLYNLDLDGPLLVIDGNHRLIEADRRGDNRISCFILNEEESIASMSYSVSRDIYVFLTSIVEIIEYLRGTQSSYRILRKIPWNRSQKHRACICGSGKKFEECCMNKGYYEEHRA